VLSLLWLAVGSTSLTLVVIGFALLNLGLNPAITLTYDLILTSAPPERAGTASGTAETGNELGIALGVAIAGSVGSAVYRRQVTEDALPPGLPAEPTESARDTLGGAVAAARDLPDRVGEPLLALTRDAFVQGMQVTSVALAILLAGVTVMVTRLARHRPD
jgi:MFS transporter, DHA2 family, multidrug resistance protein